MKQCVVCGAKGRIHMHHIIYPEEGPETAVPLCVPCHGLALGRDASYEDRSVRLTEMIANWQTKGVRAFCDDCGTPLETRRNANGWCWNCYLKHRREYLSDELFGIYLNNGCLHEVA